MIDDLASAIVASEYEAVAEWCARAGLKGTIDDPLPSGLSARCLNAINNDTDAFAERVRACAYALAMSAQPEGA